ncbi:MAG: flippase-like domain-containing protein [Lachnospiraceae bacterium]|nr:flippase-like domain-containing protein [Lachnospiraceae bacterium]
MHEGRKRVLEGAFFLAVMGLSFYTIFHGQDMGQVRSALGRLSPAALCLAVVTALFFVSAEGIMIWYLLRSMNGKSGLLKCISYSFIGFFYSGITPSATGGQPMQLYYMCKDKNGLSESSVVLMTVALIYKFVLVLIGIAMLVFWHEPLKLYLREYFLLFLLGLALNLTLVLILLAVMFAPGWIKGVIVKAEKLLVRMHILKGSALRQERIEKFVGGYQESVHFLATHKGKVVNVCLFTLLQRCSVFVLTWIIYSGFSLEGSDVMTVTLLQASVYIAVDMLPVPGAQGITELMYRSVFGVIFAGGYLMPSLYVTRGISFYFLLIVGIVVIFGNYLYRRCTG